MAFKTDNAHFVIIMIMKSFGMAVITEALEVITPGRHRTWPKGVMSKGPLLNNRRDRGISGGAAMSTAGPLKPPNMLDGTHLSVDGVHNLHARDRPHAHHRVSLVNIQNTWVALPSPSKSMWWLNLLPPITTGVRTNLFGRPSYWPPAYYDQHGGTRGDTSADYPEWCNIHPWTTTLWAMLLLRTYMYYAYKVLNAQVLNINSPYVTSHLDLNRVLFSILQGPGEDNANSPALMIAFTEQILCCTPNLLWHKPSQTM